jgi:hypothetical protein
VERLGSKYLGQIVQILINLEQFEYACQELEVLLVEARQSNHGGEISLKATEQFRAEKKTAEKRIFELVNSKIDDLVETAEYNWMTTKKQGQPSEYLQQMTLFLGNIMSSTLLGLPKDIKGLIYFDALSHIATSILVRLFLPRSILLKLIYTRRLYHLPTPSRKSPKLLSQT